MSLQLMVLFIKIERNILHGSCRKIYPLNLKVVTDDASAANSFAIDVAGFTNQKK
jgi:hypothetical protein